MVEKVEMTTIIIWEHSKSITALTGRGSSNRLCPAFFLDSRCYAYSLQVIFSLSPTRMLNIILWENIQRIAIQCHTLNLTQGPKYASPLRVDFAHFEGWYISKASVHMDSLPGEDLLQVLAMPLWQICGLEAQHSKEVFPSICSTRSQWLQPPIGSAPLQGSTRKLGARVN